MAFELRDGQGSAFYVTEKKAPTHPDIEGKVILDGRTIYINGWEKVAQSGKRWISLSAKYAQPEQPKDYPEADFDDEIPF